MDCTKRARIRPRISKASQDHLLQIIVIDLPWKFPNVRMVVLLWQCVSLSFPMVHNPDPKPFYSNRMRCQQRRRKYLLTDFPNTYRNKNLVRLVDRNINNHHNSTPWLRPLYVLLNARRLVFLFDKKHFSVKKNSIQSITLFIIEFN